MEKTLTVVEAREMFGENCFETETGFLVNVFGKYCPNVTFVVSKEVELDANGKPINPLTYISDREVTDSMNMDFDGDAEFMFGDFWWSKKGGACFRPKSPKFAKDLLVRVDWGGCFNSHRGTYSDEANAIEGVKYFRRASSNGGGAGYDYWVVPVGFYRALHIEEVDGDTKSAGTTSFKARAKAYREKYARLQKEASEANDRAYKAKLAAEEESRASREKYLPRLTEIQAELAELHRPQKFDRYGVSEISFGETRFELGYDHFLYNEDSLAKAEAYLVHAREWVSTEEAKRQAEADARAAFEPKFEELRSRIEEFGRELSFDEEGARVKDPAKASASRWSWSNGVTTYSYDQAGLDALLTEIQAEEARLEAEKAAEELKKAQAEAKALGLPGNVRLWHRSGATNAGKAWVIGPNGMERECDLVDTMVCGSNSKRYHQSYEGDHVWNQILPGELVIYWSHAYTAAPHEFRVIYRPETLTEAQLERVAEIQNELEEEFFGKSGLTGTRTCPSIGQGWGLFHREE